jgi:hypothetical protein
MNEKQALKLIKQALDDANSQGCFKNLDLSAALLQAISILNEFINPKEQQENV